MTGQQFLYLCCICCCILAPSRSDDPLCAEDCSGNHKHHVCDETCPESHRAGGGSGGSGGGLPSCATNIDHLAPFKVDLYPHALDGVNRKYQDVSLGGAWKPQDCVAEQKVAIVVPYRDRAEDLMLFLNNLHGFLQQQHVVEYRVYLVEQADDKHFNRGVLLNIGVVESQKDADYDCIVLHDVDKYPEDTRNVYRCGDKPRHLISKMKYKNQSSYRPNPYNSYFGGVTAISLAQYKLANGFSNRFWGWGSEDDDLHNRLKHHEIETTRVDEDVGKFAEIWHPFGFVNPNRHKLAETGEMYFQTDGLSDVSYDVKARRLEPLYTLISVQILHPDPFYEQEKEEL